MFFLKAPHHRWFSTICLAVAIAVATPSRSDAQSMNIAAIVNEDLITVYDLYQRISLVIAFSNMQDAPQVRQRLAPDVLRRLISEKLRTQEAKRLEVTIPDERVAASLQEIERNNKMPPGGLDQFLNAKGIDKNSLEDQIRTDLMWVQTVTRLFRGLVSVSDQQIEDEIQKIQANAGKPEYLLSEIVLAFDDKSVGEVAAEAERLTQQLKAGASWDALARTFSQSASADDAGLIGWQRAEMLPPPVAAVVARLQPGQVSNPVRTDDGYYIVLLRNVRTAEGIAASKGAERVTLHQLQLPVPPGADAQRVADITGQAQTLAHGAADCTAFDAAAKANGGPLSGPLGTFDTASLSPQIKELIANVPVNGASQPMRTSDSVVVMMVCARESDQGNDPLQKKREEIRVGLLNEQLNRLALQHEQKLRLQSFIDVRL